MDAGDETEWDNPVLNVPSDGNVNTVLGDLKSSIVERALGCGPQL